MTAIATWTDPVAIDNCGEVFVTPESDGFVSGDEYPCGVSGVNYVAFDQAGNASFCSFTVEVLCDTCDPIIECPSDTTVIACTEDLMFPDVNPIIDDCGFAINLSVIAPSIDSVDICSWIRTTKWIISYQDTSFVCEQDILIKSDSVLTITCPADITINCTQNPDTLLTSSPAVGDHCGWLELTFTDSIPTPNFCNQTLFRNWVAIDSCNAVGICTQLITVQDIDPPIFTFCPPDTLVRGTIIGETCIADLQLPSPIVTDSCNNPIELRNNYTNSVDASGSYPEGTTTVVWTATDICGNSATCSMNVFVQACDTCLPLILCPLDTLIAACPNDPLLTDFGAPVIIDSCDHSIEIVFQRVDTVAQDDCSLVLEKTWIINDGMNFLDTCRQVIRIENSTPPVINCPLNILVDCSDFSVPDPDFTGRPMVVDACEESLSIDFFDQTIEPICPLVIERIWTLRSACSNLDLSLIHI